MSDLKPSSQVVKELHNTEKKSDKECRAEADGARQLATRGRVRLNPQQLKTLRYQRGISQAQLAIEAEIKRLPLSISTIKRAELGAAVIFRSAQHLATLLETKLSCLQFVEDPGDYQK